MNEAIKVILSAWSVGLIVLFIIVTSAIVHGAKIDEGIALVWLFLLFGSVTGAGWLFYRMEAKDYSVTENEDGK